MPAASLLAISYHYVRPGAELPHPGIHPLSPETFLRQLELLQSHHPVLTPAQLETWLAGDPLHERALLLTFDDGLRDHMSAAATLESLGMRGVFFVCSRPAAEGRALPVHKIHWLRAHTPPGDFIDQFSALLPTEWKNLLAAPPSDIQQAAAETYQFDAPAHQVLKYLINFVLPYECVDDVSCSMLSTHGLDEASFCAFTYLSPEEICQLSKRGHLIGCHGHLHQAFSRFPPPSLLLDVEKNKAFIYEAVGLMPDTIAYPYGSEWSLPNDTRRFANDAGIRAAFTYRRGWNTQNTPHHCLKRIDCNEIHEHLVI